MNISRVKRIAVLGLFALAVFFALYKLTESPPFWYDEGWYVQTGANLATNGIDGVQLAPGYIQHIPALTVGYPLIYVLGFWFQLFGVGVMSARMLMVVFILALLTVSYMLAHRVSPGWRSIGVLALLVTFAPLYGNGKSVLGEVPGMLYLVLALLCFRISVDTGNPKKRAGQLVVAGLCAGLCVATKPVFILFLPALAIAGYVAYARRTTSAREIGMFAAACVVPILVWLIVQFHGGGTNILSFYANPYGEASLVHVFLENVRRVLTDSSTLYTFGLMAVWAAALVVRIKRKEQIRLEEIAAFWFSVMIILAFLRIGSVYRYLFPAQVLELVFFPATLGALSGKRRWISGAAVILLALLGIYQVGWKSWIAEAYSSDKTAFWENYMQSLPASESVFFYDTPEVAALMRSRNYYQYFLAPAGHPTGPEELSVLRNGGADLVIVASAKYEPLRATLFSRYETSTTAYKYSILRRK